LLRQTLEALAARGTGFGIGLIGWFRVRVGSSGSGQDAQKAAEQHSQ